MTEGVTAQGLLDCESSQPIGNVPPPLSHLGKAYCPWTGSSADPDASGLWLIRSPVTSPCSGFSFATFGYTRSHVEC